MVQKSSLKPKIIILCGPTGVGKTELAISLAEKINAEIIVADSQSVLKGFDIGTAKPSPEEREKISHHLMDVVSYGEPFDAATFSRLADEVICSIFSRKKQVIVSGGTGLYLKALLFGLMEAPKRDDKIREKLEERILKKGMASLYQELQTLDPKRAKEIHPHDAVRIIRALEIAELAGKPSDLVKNHGFQKEKYEALKIGLTRPREELHQRINDRVLMMLNRGWVEEVKNLMEQGIDLIHGKTKTIGYPTLARHLKGEIFIKEAIEEIQKESRKLAKRQMTWFRADKQIQWFHPDQGEEIFKKMEAFLHNK